VHTPVSTVSGICYTVTAICRYRGKAGTGLIVLWVAYANRPDNHQQHCYHHAPTVKPEAATAVVELLMMGVKTRETC
jgi:hypothetical protein